MTRNTFRGLTSGTMTVLAVSVLMGTSIATPAGAAEAEAKTAFKAMSDYMAAQTDFSFDYDSDLEIVTRDQQKLALASSGSMTVERPDKIRAERTGGFTDVELVFDGKTVSLLGKEANAYGQADIPGTLDQLIDALRDDYERPIPGADLLLSDIYGELMPLVTDVKDLGSGMIGGVECDHFAFRTDEVDWQIWIAQGDRPYPCRYVVTSKSVRGSPEYSIDVRNWKTGSEVDPVEFAFQAPANAKKLDLKELPDTDELPKTFLEGGVK